MVKHEIGSVVVVKGRRPVGIVTERDILKQAAKAGKLAKPVGRLRSKSLITAEPSTSVQETFETMLKNKIRRLPIVHGSDLVGIVTEKDLMRWALRVSHEPNIPPHIKAVLDAH
jgi:CBS domain-containing protein